MNNMIDSTGAQKGNSSVHLNVSTGEALMRNVFPATADFYAEISTPIIVQVVVAAALCLMTCLLYLRQVPWVLKNTPTKFVTRTLFLCTLYPVVATAAFVSVAVPRSWFLCETISHLAFTVCAYQFFCLCLDYTDGESNFIKVAADKNVFNVRTPPCCCWMVFLKPVAITKKRFLMLRILILQMPIVQSILMLAMNIINIDDTALFMSVNLYVLPFVVLSIIFGVWGLQMTVRMIGPLFMEYRIMGKYFVLQLVLLMVKVTPPLVRAIMSYIPMDHTYPLTGKVIDNMIAQMIILTEMVLMSIWAHRVYMTPERNN